MLRLKDARRQRGLTQHALAARAGVGDSTVLRAERGTHRTQPHVARRLAAALGLRPEEVAELRAAVTPIWVRSQTRRVSPQLT